MSKSTFDFSWKHLFRRSIKKIEIISEKKQTIRISKKTKRNINMCQLCQEDAVFLSSIETARLFEVDLEFIELFIVEKSVHFIEFEESETVICLKSLVKKLKNTTISI